MVKILPDFISACIFFFSFGHISIFIEASSIYQKAGEPSWIINVLLPILLLSAMLLSIRSIIKLESGFDNIYSALNTASMILVLFPLITILYNYSSRNISSGSHQQRIQPSPEENALLPDVYYIILDAYGRHDSLMSIGYDNSGFITEMEDIGFYVASCSRSNYPQTSVSMASSLNMGYLWDVIPNTGSDDRNSKPVYDRIIHSQVRQEFEDRGYRIVAFDSGAQWLNWRDADLFIKPTPDSFFSLQLSTFEHIFFGHHCHPSIYATTLFPEK